MKVRDEFTVHRLNDAGMTGAVGIASGFSHLLNGLEEICGKDGREMALVRTKLQEACFYAKRALAQHPAMQDSGGTE